MYICMYVDASDGIVFKEFLLLPMNPLNLFLNLFFKFIFKFISPLFLQLILRRSISLDAFQFHLEDWIGLSDETRVVGEGCRLTKRGAGRNDWRKASIAIGKHRRNRQLS